MTESRNQRLVDALAALGVEARADIPRNRLLEMLITATIEHDTSMPSVGIEPNVFAGASRGEAIAALTTYTNENPDWTAAYNENLTLNVRIDYTDEAGNAAAEFFYRSSDLSSWVSNANVKGVKGADAPELRFQYSATGVDGWSNELDTNIHEYWRWSTDGGKTWSANGVRYSANSDGLTDQQREDIENNRNSSHTHANKSILDATTGTFTIERQYKLDGVQDTFRGVFGTPLSLASAIPNPSNGWAASVIDTSSIWVALNGVWEDTGAKNLGDMMTNVYDPQGVAKDVYDRANHNGAQSIGTITGLQEELDKIPSLQNSINQTNTNVTSVDDKANTIDSNLTTAKDDLQLQITELKTREDNDNPVPTFTKRIAYPSSGSLSFQICTDYRGYSVHLYVGTGSCDLYVSSGTRLHKVSYLVQVDNGETYNRFFEFDFGAGLQYSITGLNKGSTTLDSVKGSRIGQCFISNSSGTDECIKVEFCLHNTTGSSFTAHVKVT